VPGDYRDGCPANQDDSSTPTKAANAWVSGTTRVGRREAGVWWRWGRVELPVQSPSAATTTSVSDRFRQPSGRGSALSRSVQSRASRSSLIPDYATLIRTAAPLNDASTTRGTGVASTLTLPPKRRGRESTACWQLLRFAACLTRPDGTSARVHCLPDPVETTHPHRIGRARASWIQSSRGGPIGQ
jgi:hypothetical protein